MSLRLRNASEQPFEVASVVVGFSWRDHGVASHRFLRHGWQSWSYTGTAELDAGGVPEFPSGSWLRGMHHGTGEEPADRRGWWESDLVSVVGASPSGPCCCVGALERGHSFGVVYARPSGQSGQDVQIEVELRVDAAVDPGESRELESLRVELGTDATALLERFADELGRNNAARTAHSFVAGWCSWYHFFHDVTEQDILRNLEALANDRDGLPVDVVQIDDGYQHAIGDWLETNSKFPRGLAPLAREIRAAGFTAGLWTAPFNAVPESRFASEHPDWLLEHEGAPFRGLLHPEWSADAAVYVLDTSRAEVLAHLEGVFSELVGMGFQYLKLDFLYSVAMKCTSSDPRVSRAERLRRGLEAIRRGAGEEAFLLGCGCPLGAAVGIVDGMRIGPDVAPHWDFDPTRAIPGLEPAMPSTRSALRSVLARSWMHRRLWLNDPDCLMARATDTALSRDERESLAGAIAATGGMLVFSDDVPLLAREDRELIRETRAVAEAVDALGVPGTARVPNLLAHEIAQQVVATGPEADYAFALNAGDAPASLAFGSDSIELPAHASAFDVRRHAFKLAVFCDFDGTFSVQDVGSTLAKRHAGPERDAMWASYERGELEPWDYNMEILDGLACPLGVVREFLETVELDPGARDLVDWCASHRVPFRIVSDGFDSNLNRLQTIHRLRFAQHANHLHYDDGVWRIRAGGRDAECGCGTGTCKRARIEALRAFAPDATIVHIGNGRVSDTCGALAADVAFAKDSLADELDRRGATYTRYATLHDVIGQLEKLL